PSTYTLSLHDALPIYECLHVLSHGCVCRSVYAVQRPLGVECGQRECESVGLVELHAAFWLEASEAQHHALHLLFGGMSATGQPLDRKSTRLNSSHVSS